MVQKDRVISNPLPQPLHPLLLQVFPLHHQPMLKDPFHHIRPVLTNQRMRAASSTSIKMGTVFPDTFLSACMTLKRRSTSPTAFLNQNLGCWERAICLTATLSRTVDAALVTYSMVLPVIAPLSLSPVTFHNMSAVLKNPKKRREIPSSRSIYAIMMEARKSSRPSVKIPLISSPKTTSLAVETVPTSPMIPPQPLHP